MVIFFNRKLPLWMARKMWAPGMLFIYGAKINTTGLAHIDRKKTYIYVANHQSFLDIPVLFYALQVNFYFVAKKELKKIPFLGWYMSAVGMIFIDRENRKKAVLSLKNASKLIEGGKNVITFPEGTRSISGEIGVFKKGTFHLAASTNVDLLPVRLENTGKIWNPVTQKTTSGRVYVRVGEPISTSDLSLKNLDEYIEKVRNTVINL
jgi:1-acyl-sn-glycerol-3-phosphate acyltransferase